MSHENLVKRFEQAGLVLKLSDKPLIGTLTRGGRAIVQIDIDRKIKGSRRTEWFRIYPGHEDNRIEVLSTDKRIGQLVLLVHEPAREFEESVTITMVGKLRTVEEVAARLNVRVATVRKEGGKFFTKRKTSSQKRHFLCGLDERQLFIAQLPRSVTTVKEAHASLKTATVTLAEGNMGKATRQGEWFFIRATDSEAERIEMGTTKNILTIERSAPIGPFMEFAGRLDRKVKQFRGKPHTAEELIILPGDPLSHGFAVRSREIFVRGKVRHEDHATVKFSTWHKVIRNNEPNSGNATGRGNATGVGWID